MKKYTIPVMLLILFETVAIVLWQTKDNLFYLLNFSYIGFSIALGLFLFIKKYRHARRVTQLLVGLYMLLYLGLACNENMQIEGFWYYLFTGVFEAATIHYAVAKIFGPLIFGRGWCGYACWTAMILDFLPYKIPRQPRKRIGWIRYIVFIVSLVFILFLASNISSFSILSTYSCNLISIVKYKLLIIDEIDYLPIDVEGANLLFQLINRRYEKNSIIITTNKAFSKWGELFGDATIANEILDRLLHHSHIINITGKSYRLKDKIKQTTKNEEK